MHHRDRPEARGRLLEGLLLSRLVLRNNRDGDAPPGALRSGQSAQSSPETSSQRILYGLVGMQTTEQMSARSPQGAGTVLSNLVRFPQTAGLLGEGAEPGFGT